ncbi:hypothetical protein WA1_17960 [Scytonema hofmannii PCC 7110]|uniref:Uncharacterized protein n=2 Tax=Scytonema hofmannii TaxID=34078 RepID=A0A139XB24_9CYAN|nr:hypothetical protein WA1_17960 [Scytonema hofmannii PCC 7110]
MASGSLLIVFGAKRKGDINTIVKQMKEGKIDETGRCSYTNIICIKNIFRVIASSTTDIVPSISNTVSTSQTKTLADCLMSQVTEWSNQTLRNLHSQVLFV